MDLNFPPALRLRGALRDSWQVGIYGWNEFRIYENRVRRVTQSGGEAIPVETLIVIQQENT